MTKLFPAFVLFIAIQGWGPLTAESRIEEKLPRVYKALKSERYDKAFSDLQKLQQDFPSSHFPPMLEGWICQLKGNFTKAETRFSDALLLAPAQGEIYFFRAQCRKFLKQYDKALQDMELCVSLDTAPRQLVAFYRSIYGLDFHQSKLDITSQIFAERADSYARLNRHDAALKDLNQALSLTPENHELQLKKAFTLLGLKYYRLAIEVFRQLPEASFGAMQRSEMHTAMGICDWNLAGFAAAHGNFLKAYQENPCPRTRMNLGLSHWFMGDRDQALETMELACREGTNGTPFYHLAYFTHVSGDHQKAKRLYEQALVKDPELVQQRIGILKRTMPGSMLENFYQTQIGVCKSYVSDQSEQKVGHTTENSELKLVFEGISVLPNPVSTGVAFDIEFLIRTEGQQTNGASDAILTFKILRDDKVLYRSSENPLTLSRGNYSIWKEHMNGVPISGVFTVAAEVRWQDQRASRQLDFTIK